MSLVPWILGPALLGLLWVAIGAARRPILLRLAWRNLGRRRAQALAIALGLMVGTALIAGALATGDSMTFAIRRTSIQAFGALDEMVALEGRLYFPAAVADRLADDAGVRATTDGLEAIMVEDVAVGHAAAHQSEPRTALIGLDPARDAAFGLFRTANGPRDASSLGPAEAILNERLARSLQAKAGDQITVRYAPRPDPLLPRVFLFNGTLSAAAGSPVPFPPGAGPGPVPLPPLPSGPLPPLPPPYATNPLDEATFPVPVEAGAVRVTAVLLWGSPQNATDLDVALVQPDGAYSLNANGTAGQPDAPAFLNATATPGNWTARVLSKAAAEQRFTLVVLVFYEVHDLAQLQAFVEDLQSRPGAQEFLANLTGNLRLEARNFTVKFVAQEPGRGSFLNAPDVFVRLDVAQEMFQKRGQANLLMVSNPGDEEQGLAGTPAAMAALEPALAALKARAAPSHDWDGLRATAIKQQYVEAAEEAGGLFTSFLTTMASFSILAGLILIINIFVMLTEERRGELGVARALGMTRGDLTRLFVYEGAAYAVGASLLGALLGLGVSFGLMAALNATLGDAVNVELTFHPTLDAFLLAFGAGVLMTLGAVAIASYRAARLNIVRSIRRLEEPDTPLGRGAFLSGLALVALGVAASLYAFARADFTAEVLAPNLAIAGLGLVASRGLARTRAAMLAGAAMFAYNMATVFTLDTPATTAGMIIGPFRGVLIVVGAVLVLVQSQRLLRWSGDFLARFDRFRPVARTALAYPLHKKLRTTLTVTMFALVLTVVVLFSIFFAMFTPNLAEQAGGYDVRADSTLPIQDLAARLQASERAYPVLAGVASVASLEYAEIAGGRLIKVEGEPVRYRGPPVDYIYGLDQRFVDSQEFPMMELAPGYATGKEALQAVLHDPHLIVVSRLYSNGADGRPGIHHPGSTLTMTTRGGTLNFTIIGIQKQVYLGGVFVSKALVESNFEALHGYHLLKVKPGADADAVATALEASQEDAGVDAAGIATEAGVLLQQERSLYLLFEVYLGLGLILGIASLGIITARSVLERRQEVGMLRALGLPRAMVFRSFVVEGLFVVTLGAAIGVGVGVVVAWGVHLKSLASLGIAFVVPWTDLAVILAIAYVATLAAVLGPARRAAALAPAEAIRYIE